MGIIMKIVTVIGTRPQYIKLKPLYDYFKNNDIDNYIIDTNQHYSDNVSKNLIEELGLKIDCNLGVVSSDEISFISNGISSIYYKLKELCDKDSTIIVMGDTNSTLVASIAAKKLGLKLAHIEAGIRCQDRNRPEELNRIIIDSISDIHFISRIKDWVNVSNAIYVGDLEYFFLNSIEKDFPSIAYDGPILMTIHRQENLNKSRLVEIFNFCHVIEYPIVFPIHHRTRNFVEKNNILISDNIEIIKPLNYKDMICLMRKCRGVISDSGGVTKTCPFFGKKCVVPLDKLEWDELLLSGYAVNWFNEEWFDDCKIERDMNFYYVKDSCKRIVNALM